jgi:hypothetical protein
MQLLARANLKLLLRDSLAFQQPVDFILVLGKIV